MGRRGRNARRRKPAAPEVPPGMNAGDSSPPHNGDGYRGPDDGLGPDDPRPEDIRHWRGARGKFEKAPPPAR
jgi:hypothetical protein